MYAGFDIPFHTFVKLGTRCFLEYRILRSWVIVSFTLIDLVKPGNNLLEHHIP